jgi:hypothetical protein
VKRPVRKGFMAYKKEASIEDQKTSKNQNFSEFFGNFYQPHEK